MPGGVFVQVVLQILVHVIGGELVARCDNEEQVGGTDLPAVYLDEALGGGEFRSIAPDRRMNDCLLVGPDPLIEGSRLDLAQHGLAVPRFRRGQAFPRGLGHHSPEQHAGNHREPGEVIPEYILAGMHRLRRGDPFARDKLENLVHKNELHPACSREVSPSNFPWWRSTSRISSTLDIAWIASGSRTMSKSLSSAAIKARIPSESHPGTSSLRVSPRMFSARPSTHSAIQDNASC